MLQTISPILNIISDLFLLLGVILSFVSILGLKRFPDLFSKQHALGILDTGATFFICLGLALKFPNELFSLKVILLSFVVALVSAPLCYLFMQILIIKNKLKN